MFTQDATASLSRVLALERAALLWCASPVNQSPVFAPDAAPVDGSFPGPGSWRADSPVLLTLVCVDLPTATLTFAVPPIALSCLLHVLCQGYERFRQTFVIRSYDHRCDSCIDDVTEYLVRQQERGKLPTLAQALTRIAQHIGNDLLIAAAATPADAPGCDQRVDEVQCIDDIMIGRAQLAMYTSGTLICVGDLVYELQNMYHARSFSPFITISPVDDLGLLWSVCLAQVDGTSKRPSGPESVLAPPSSMTWSSGFGARIPPTPSRHQSVSLCLHIGFSPSFPRAPPLVMLRQRCTLAPGIGTHAEQLSSIPTLAGVVLSIPELLPTGWSQLTSRCSLPQAVHHIICSAWAQSTQVTDCAVVTEETSAPPGCIGYIPVPAFASALHRRLNFPVRFGVPDDTAVSSTRFCKAVTVVSAALWTVAGGRVPENFEFGDKVLLPELFLPLLPLDTVLTFDLRVCAPVDAQRNANARTCGPGSGAGNVTDIESDIGDASSASVAFARERVYVGVLEFWSSCSTDQLGSEVLVGGAAAVVVPSWMFQRYCFCEGESALLSLVTLPQLTGCTLQPLGEELTCAAEACGQSVADLLERALQPHSVVSAGTEIQVGVLGHCVRVFVVATEPPAPACQLWAEFSSRVALQLEPSWSNLCSACRYCKHCVLPVDAAPVAAASTAVGDAVGSTTDVSSITTSTRYPCAAIGPGVEYDGMVALNESAPVPSQLLVGGGGSCKFKIRWSRGVLEAARMRPHPSDTLVRCSPSTTLSQLRAAVEQACPALAALPWTLLTHAHAHAHSSQMVPLSCSDAVTVQEAGLGDSVVLLDVRELRVL